MVKPFCGKDENSTLKDSIPHSFAVGNRKGEILCEWENSVFSRNFFLKKLTFSPCYAMLKSNQQPLIIAIN